MEVQIARGGEVLGTYPITNIPTLVASGSILTSDHYWHEGMNDWAPVGNTWQTTTTQKPVIANSAKLSVLAIVAIALGILALPLALIVIGVVLAIGAIVCGHLALSAAKRDQSSISRNVALTGTVLGYLAVVIALAVILLQAGILAFIFSKNIDEARKSRVEADFQAITTQLRTYEMMNERMPNTDQGLEALVTQPSSKPAPRRWVQLLERVPLDPWGEPYKYRNPGALNPRGIDLISKGPDREEGTKDDITNSASTGN